MRLLDALRASPQRTAIAVASDRSILCVRRVRDAAEMATSLGPHTPLEDGCGWEVLGSGEPIMRATLVEINAIMAGVAAICGPLDWQAIVLGEHSVAESAPDPDVEAALVKLVPTMTAMNGGNVG